MLQLTDIEASIPLAQELTEKGLKLEAKLGPLAMLVSEHSVAAAVSSSAVGMDEEALKNYIPNLVSMLFDTSTSITKVEGTTVLDESNHDFKMEEFSDLIACGVQATLHKVKSIIIPTIKHIEECIDNGMKNYVSRSIANISIDEVGLDEVLDNEAVYEYFDQYKDRKLINLRNTNFFPKLEAIAIARLIEAGDPEINQYLQSKLLLEANGRTLGEMVYEFIYCGDRLTDSFADIIEFRNIVKELYGESVQVISLLLAYYMGKGLINTLPEGVSAGLRDVEHRVGLMTGTLGMMIFNEIENYRKSVNNNVLFPIGLPYVNKVTGEVNTNFNIRVNKDVYAQFLADGGTPEIVYGSMVSDGATDPKLLIAKAAYYENQYQRFVDINRSYSLNSVIEIYTNSIRDGFYDYLADNEEMAAFTTATGVYVRLLARLKTLGGDHVSSPEKTYDFLRSMISYVLYPDHPEYEQVISNIDNFTPRDGEENLSVPEIAAIVLIDMIVDWLADQIVVRKA